MSDSVLNAGPAAAKGPATANAAKNTPAKAATTAKLAAGNAAATGSDAYGLVLDIMSAGPGKIKASPKGGALVLLVTALLEQRRTSLFDLNGLYVGELSFTALVKELLAGMNGAPGETGVLAGMRRSGVYRSERDGSQHKITFFGSDEARKLVAQLAAGDGAGEIPATAPSDTKALADPRIVESGDTAVRTGLAAARVLGNAEVQLVDNTVNDVFRLVGNDRGLALLVAEEILSRRFA